VRRGRDWLAVVVLDVQGGERRDCLRRDLVRAGCCLDDLAESVLVGWLRSLELFRFGRAQRLVEQARRLESR
jgi:hypothetical protein